MRIGFIGAGKVATAFGRYLYSHDIAISGYCDRHPEKVSHATDGTQSRPLPDTAAVAEASEIILITTRDDQIKDACNDLCFGNAITARHLVGHMSGAHSSRILEKAESAGAVVFSLHPLQAFADEKKAVAELPGTYFSLEGKQTRLQPIKTILSKVGNPYFCISPEHKSLYHLSACIISNYLVALMDAGLAALEKSGIDRKEGFKAMSPLIQGTLSNIAGMGAAKALTGPIARGDAGTIEQHLQALANANLPGIESLYRHMGLQTLSLAEQNAGASSRKLEILRQALENK